MTGCPGGVVETKDMLRGTVIVCCFLLPLLLFVFVEDGSGGDEDDGTGVADTVVDNNDGIGRLALDTFVGEEGLFRGFFTFGSSGVDVVVVLLSSSFFDTFFAVLFFDFAASFSVNLDDVATLPSDGRGASLTTEIAVVTGVLGVKVLCIIGCSSDFFVLESSREESLLF
jgi:hypothetical protein